LASDQVVAINDDVDPHFRIRPSRVSDRHFTGFNLVVKGW
jgi:hypothetical protein